MHPAQLLSTKLFVVRPHTDIVHRDRLIRKLDAMPQRTLTLISAPAGFGKTTLISTWIELHRYPTAWLSLDGNDDELPRFLTYLIAALQTLYPELGVEPQRMLGMTPPPATDSLLTLLVNDIARAPEDFLLVLEDYHTIEKGNIHEALLFLLEHAPAQLHVVMTTRIDPEIPLSRFRVRGQLLELRAADLRFTPDESAMLFNEQLRLALGPQQIEALEERTEGWIAGLKMAALSMEGRTDINEFITDFTGTDRYVLDYLLEEVLSRQPEEIQRALLQISILDSFNASLCEAITDVPSGVDLLATLEHANLFLISLDNRREWYRYHHLFADLLRHHLHKAYGETTRELHRRASQWYQKHERIGEALAHAYETHDIELLIQLLKHYWIYIISTKEISEPAIGKYLSIVPQKEVRESPRLCLIKGWQMDHERLIDELASLMDDAERELQRSDDEKDSQEIRAWIYHIRMSIANRRGNYAEAVAMGRKALDEVAHRPADQIYGLKENSVLMYLGLVYSLAGDPAAAVRAWEDVLRSSRAEGNITATITMLHNLTLSHINAGRLSQAWKYCEEILNLKEGIDTPLKNSLTFQIDVAHVRQKRAVILYERNQLEAARTEALTALELYPSGLSYQLLPVMRVLLQIYEAENDREGVYRTLAECERLPLPANASQYQTVVPTLRAYMHLKEGNLDAVEEWADSMFGENRSQLPQRAYSMMKLEELLYIRFLLTQERFDEADMLLEQIQKEVEGRSLVMFRIETLMLQGVLLDRRGKGEEALDRFSRALHLAAPEGMLRHIVNEGAPAARLLVRYMERRARADRAIVSGAYLKLLGDAFGLGVPEAVTLSQQKSSGELNVLTERELEILQLLSLGYSNQKIAGKLYISINTVKTHISNLFEKLDAGNRTEAIIRAREEKLLE